MNTETRLEKSLQSAGQVETGKKAKMNPRTRILETIRQCTPRNAAPNPLTGQERLLDLGFSSLRLIGLIVALEDSFNLTAEVLMSLRADMSVDGLVSACCKNYNDQPRAGMAISNITGEASC
jgi:hypothetical protein